MRVTVIGAGAVGGWIAATLAKGGADVSVVARGATLEHIQQHGLVLVSGDQRESYRLPTAERATALPLPDVVVLAVKTYAFVDAVTSAAPVLQHAPALVTAMNGLPWWFLQAVPKTAAGWPLSGQHLDSIDPGGRAGALLANVRPAGAVVHASMRAEAPGVIRLGKVDRLILGEPSGDVSRETSMFHQHFRSGGSECVLTKDIRIDIWAKLWGNMNMNPVSALTRLGSSGILGDPRLRALVRDMMTEFAAIGDRLGLALPTTVDERVAVTQRLGDFRTSMLQDVEAGRPMEVEGLLGVVVELAEKLGVPVPASSAVYALAQGLNSRR